MNAARSASSLPPRREWESRDSASPAVGRAVAAGHARRPFQALDLPFWRRLLMMALNGLPHRLRVAAVRLDSRRAALPPAAAAAVRTEHLVTARLADYQAAPQQVDAMVIGAALGGAAAHLTQALGGLFLPQPFVLTFRGGSPADSLEQHLARVARLAPSIMQRNPDLLTLSHFDPVHDGWLTRDVTHIRLKLLRLPQGYRDFIRARLRPGGALVFLDCGARWPQATLGPRQRLQVGGWGAIDAQEFLQGSKRLDAWLAKRGSPHRGGWAGAGLAFESFPESEWGVESELVQDTRDFAAVHGYRFIHLRFSHPQAFSLLALKAQRLRCAKQGMEPQGILVESFGHYDPVAADRAGLLPLWLIFNTWDSREFLQKTLATLPAHLPVLFCGLVTFSRPPDMVPWGGWWEAMGDRKVYFFGPRASHYPADLPALWRWHGALWRWVTSHPRSLHARLDAEDLAALAEKLERERHHPGHERAASGSLCGCNINGQ